MSLALEPRLTPGLIGYRIEVEIEDRWYFWGLSASPEPDDFQRYKVRHKTRSEPVWAASWRHQPQQEPSSGDRDRPPENQDHEADQADVAARE